MNASTCSRGAVSDGKARKYGPTDKPYAFSRRLPVYESHQGPIGALECQLPVHIHHRIKTRNIRKLIEAIGDKNSIARICGINGILNICCRGAPIGEWRDWVRAVGVHVMSRCGGCVVNQGEDQNDS